MFDSLLSNVGQYVHTNPWLAIIAVFVGGAVTASNPCVLAMIPLMMSFVAGRREEGTGGLRAFGYSLLFVVGLSIMFAVLGVFAAIAGKLYGDVSQIWHWIVAAVCLFMGSHLLGIVPFSIPMPFNVQPKTKGALGAFLLGLLFGVVSTPCAGPILVVLLTYIAGTKASVSYGALLLLVYALGHSILIVGAGTSVGLAKRMLESRKIVRATDVMRRLAGGVIILVGVYFAYLGMK